MILEKNEIRSIVEQVKEELLPIGSILIYPSENVPFGFFPCDGSELSKSAYPELYSLIKGTWGETENSFFLPDLRGQFVRGWDDGDGVDPDSGADSIRKIGSLQEDAFQGHSHEVISCSENGRHYHYVGYKNYSTQEANTFYTTYQHEHVCTYGDPEKIGNHNTDSDGNHKHDIVIGGAVDSTFQKVRYSTETRPKNIALMFCIKVK